jgi:hypothetical protein
MKLSADSFPKVVHPLFRFFHVDFDPQRPPSNIEVVLASVVAIVGSLVADWLLVVAGTRVFPSIKGYGHFQFSDYSKLTVIGVVIACIGWPIVARVSSKARYLFTQMAVVVTIVLLAPDYYIWYQGAPTKAIFVLVLMHLAIALVTYFSLVVLAPVRRRRGPAR